MVDTPGSREKKRRHVLAALRDYFGEHSEAILALPAPVVDPVAASLPERYVEVDLPGWAADIGVAGRLLVPASCMLRTDSPRLEEVDWLAAAFHLLEALPEREHERRHGPIHSYSVRLTGWDPRPWERAWVNRIALLLRRWLAHDRATDESTLFGPPPRARITLTHDVDALTKTLPIRIKQSAFNLFNLFRALGQGRWQRAVGHGRAALRFAFARDRYDWLEEVCTLEQGLGLRSVFHVYAGGPAAGGFRGFTDWLFNPGYPSGQAAWSERLRSLHARGFEIGLHPGYAAWADDEAIAIQRQQLEADCGAPVERCRQHWLRFAWASTWPAQARAGLRRDATCGFNDRPGFRCGAALEWSPWSESLGGALPMRVQPLLLMDSHLYDYGAMDTRALADRIEHWIAEVVAVGGSATVLWHPHTLGRDYGWRAGFDTLLAIVAKVPRCA